MLGNDTMNVVGDHRVRIDGREDRVVGGEGRDTTVERRDELTVNGTSYTHVRDGFTVLADASIGLMAPVVTIDAERSVRIQRGDETTIAIDADGCVAVESPKAVALRVGECFVSLSPGRVIIDSGRGGGIDVDGTDVKIYASNEVKIDGTMVRINS